MSVPQIKVVVREKQGDWVGGTESKNFPREKEGIGPTVALKIEPGTIRDKIGNARPTIPALVVFLGRCICKNRREEERGLG